MKKLLKLSSLLKFKNELSSVVITQRDDYYEVVYYPKKIDNFKEKVQNIKIDIDLVEPNPFTSINKNQQNARLRTFESDYTTVELYTNVLSEISIRMVKKDLKKLHDKLEDKSIKDFNSDFNRACSKRDKTRNLLRDAKIESDRVIQGLCPHKFKKNQSVIYENSFICTICDLRINEENSTYENITV